MVVVKVDFKKICEECNMSYSDALWRYVSEDFLWRIRANNLEEVLWLTKPQFKECERLTLYYVESRTSKKAGSPQEILDNKILGNKEVNSRSDIRWSGYQKENIWNLKAKVNDTEIPFSVKIIVLSEEKAGVHSTTEFTALNHSHKNIKLYSYSPESILADLIFEIMEKLELIGSMESYVSVYLILKNSSISGRHIVDILKEHALEKPKVVSYRRLEQIKGYMDYAYMRKRWDKSCKKMNVDAAWEDALGLIIGFIEPLWNALCANEIFFDDWMPELGRFLG